MATLVPAATTFGPTRSSPLNTWMISSSECTWDAAVLASGAETLKNVIRHGSHGQPGVDLPERIPVGVEQRAADGAGRLARWCEVAVLPHGISVRCHSCSHRFSSPRTGNEGSAPACP